MTDIATLLAQLQAQALAELAQARAQEQRTAAALETHA